MIDIIYGKKSNPHATQLVVDSLKELECEGSLYIGYPIFDINSESTLTDALLITKDFGVTAFDLSTNPGDEEETVADYQDDIYRGLHNKFFTEKGLTKRRNLKFEITVFSFRETEEDFEDIEVVTPNTICDRVRGLPPVEGDIFKLINATIQKTVVLKPQKKRTKAITTGSKGAIMKQVELEIANLDKWQKKAAIESPDKPQRIRGLAGCGKTIILAMKAAYLHAYDNKAKIVVTFQSRALYQQFNKLIERFYFEHEKDDIDPEYLKVRHAWGSNREVGLYSEICSSMGIDALSFREAQSKYGKESAFEGACQEALDYAISIRDKIKPMFDYVLIDEAQDFPACFFKLVYIFTKNPKRIVWAYDELQNLGHFTMLPPDELFGLSSEGTPLVTLKNDDGKPKQDNMLPVCYRNPPWILTTALALGLGVYREGGLVRMFPEPSFWENIGYEVIGGKLEHGSQVNLARSRDRTPDYFERLLDKDESIQFQVCEDRTSQAKWVADQIENDLLKNELEFSDILVIFPDAYTLGSESAYLMHELRSRNIFSHVVGKGTSQDVVFLDDSVAITHIYRAKGNEAPVVYVMNANYNFSGLDLPKKRNSLFTALTRSKGWVRVTGVGENMRGLKAEFDRLCQEHDFTLEFKYPTYNEFETLDNAYTDSTDEERQQIFEGFAKIKKIKAMLKSGELSIDDLPDDIKYIADSVK